MQIVDIEQTSAKCIEFSFRKNNSLLGKNRGDNSVVLCLYLKNIFAKSTEAERCTGVKHKLTLNCLSATVEDLNL